MSSTFGFDATTGRLRQPGDDLLPGGSLYKPGEDVDDFSKNPRNASSPLKNDVASPANNVETKLIPGPSVNPMDNVETQLMEFREFQDLVSGLAELG